MKNLKIKQKILILTAIPLILTVAALMLVSVYQIRELGNQEIEEIRATMLASKREALKNYMEITQSAIAPILKSVSDEYQAQQRIKEALRAISYGDEDGYIFAFDYNGITMAHSAKPQLEGQNLLELKDSNGVRLIADLIAAARSGGGYVTYMWDKPSKGYEVPKLSYAVDLKAFGWMLGTGFYIDDIDDAIAKERAEIDEKLKTTIILSLGVGLGIMVIIIMINLWFSNRALVKPIRELAESARQMSLGKMDTVITVDSNDEIGELADAIGRMQKSLKVIFKKLKQSTNA